MLISFFSLDVIELTLLVFTWLGTFLWLSQWRTKSTNQSWRSENKDLATDGDNGDEDDDDDDDDNDDDDYDDDNDDDDDDDDDDETFFSPV